MDEYSESQSKMLCCICLIRDRKLIQLCRLKDGVNNFYSLLFSDAEAYREGFFKDTASLFICWECQAIMRRVTSFRQQACSAQKTLASIADGKVDIKSLPTFSQLTYHHKNTYDVTITSLSDCGNDHDNFIDCGITDIVKSEEEDDLPLSELHLGEVDEETPSDGVIVQENEHKRRKNLCQEVNCEKYINVNTNTDANEKRFVNKKESIKKISKRNGFKLNNLIDNNIQNCKEIEEISKKKVKNLISKKKKMKMKENKYYNTKITSAIEMQDIRERRKKDILSPNTTLKCESCIEIFKSLDELETHNTDVHSEKPDHSKCDICLCYIPSLSLQEHKNQHYIIFECALCTYMVYTEVDIIMHVKEHDKAVLKKRMAKQASKPRRSVAMMDKRTTLGYLCTECNKYFENKNQRWKHIQRHHREGYKCAVCCKRFAFKSNLARHEQLHKGPPPRIECPTCNKMIRTDLAKIHARIHTARQHYSCAACSKKFVSRASYEHHLKYTQAHAAVDILKYKCSQCDKGYRSRGELRDHVNYQHMGKTQHKCPVCSKALATRRCITRHVRRAHHGVKENARDKICQQCGKAFRDKKGLREHEFIHTGERPLSCEICGRTFRQTASLYTHRKRVHHVYPMKKQVELLETTESQQNNVS